MKASRLLIGASALWLAGCLGAGDPAVSTQPEQDLPALRVAAGLPDCPATDLTAEPVAGGLPQTQLKCIGDGDVVNLADLPREPTVITIWAQWCGPCRAESGFIAEASAELDGAVSFFGIDYNDPNEALAIEFAQVVGWRFPHVVDPEKSLQTSLGLPGIPVTLFIAESGEIVHRKTGELESTAQLRELVAEHLGVE